MLAIFAFILMLGLWSSRKRKEVGGFYERHRLFAANVVPPIVSQSIGAANATCLKGNLTTNAGEEIPFYWWEWSTSSTNYGGAAPVTTMSCFLAISFSPNTVSEEFERRAIEALQSNQDFSQKMKDAVILNTRDPYRAEKLADGSFIIFWHILERAEIMEEKINWLKNNISVKREIISPAPTAVAAPAVAAPAVAAEAADQNIMEPTFYRHDNYPMLRLKFSAAWPNLALEMHHTSAKLDKEGWDEFDSDAAFASPDSPNQAVFTLSKETIVRDAARLFSENFGGTAFILRDGVSVEEQETLEYCNDPFRLPLNEFSYAEFKRRFTGRWTNLSIELFDTAPHNGGLWRNSRELAEDFEMRNLRNADRAYLHDYLYISTWGGLLKNVHVAAMIKNNRLGIYAEDNLTNLKLKDFQALEKRQFR